MKVEVSFIGKSVLAVVGLWDIAQHDRSGTGSACLGHRCWQRAMGDVRDGPTLVRFRSAAAATARRVCRAACCGCSDCKQGSIPGRTLCCCHCCFHRTIYALDTRSEREPHGGCRAQHSPLSTPARDVLTHEAEACLPQKRASNSNFTLTSSSFITFLSYCY